jgi:hypothetical protein
MEMERAENSTVSGQGAAVFSLNAALADRRAEAEEEAEQWQR